MKAQLLTTCHAHNGHTVFCIYQTDDHRQFVVKWDRDSNDNFHLSSTVMSADDNLSGRVSSAIILGHDDDNEDTDLYHHIINDFNANDCKDLTDSIAD